MALTRTRSGRIAELGTGRIVSKSKQRGYAAWEARQLKEASMRAEARKAKLPRSVGSGRSRFMQPSVQQRFRPIGTPTTSARQSASAFTKSRYPGAAPRRIGSGAVGRFKTVNRSAKMNEVAVQNIANKSKRFLGGISPRGRNGLMIGAAVTGAAAFAAYRATQRSARDLNQTLGNPASNVTAWTTYNRTNRGY